MKKRIPAAVLVPILFPENFLNLHASNSLKLDCGAKTLRIPLNATVLLTLRSAHVDHHKSQIAFPGGAADENDSSLLATALRETKEEIGLDSKFIEIIDTLEKLETQSSDFEVTPFVGLIRERNFRLQLNRDEIEETFEVPFVHLLDPANSVFETFSRGNYSVKIKTYFYENHRIWGATGHILQRLLSHLSAPDGTNHADS